MKISGRGLRPIKLQGVLRRTVMKVRLHSTLLSTRVPNACVSSYQPEMKAQSRSIRNSSTMMMTTSLASTTALMATWQARQIQGNKIYSRGHRTRRGESDRNLSTIPSARSGWMFASLRRTYGGGSKFQRLSKSLLTLRRWCESRVAFTCFFKSIY